MPLVNLPSLPQSVPISYTLAGPDSGPLILLTHALMSTSAMYASTANYLNALGYRTLTYDHLGHGLSPAPAEDAHYSFDDFVTHIHDLIIQVTGKERCFGMIGCSIGGVLVLRYKMRFGGTPAEPKKTISCDAPGVKALDGSGELWGERMKLWRERGLEELARRTVERWFPDPVPDGVKEEALAMNLQCTYDGYRVYAEGISTYDYEEESKMMDAKPCMVLVGENDGAVGGVEKVREWAEAISGCRFVVMRETGHLPPLHQRKTFEEIVGAFLKEESGEEEAELR